MPSIDKSVPPKLVYPPSWDDPFINLPPSDVRHYKAVAVVFFVSELVMSVFQKTVMDG